MKTLYKSRVIALLDELLQRPDILIDAVQNPDTNWDAESLLNFASEVTHRSQPSEQKQFEGEISNVKVWDRALTPEEIQEECEKDVSKEDVIKKFLEYSSTQRLQARNDTVEDCIKVVIRLGGIRYYGNHEAVAVLGEALAELEKLKNLTP